MHEAAVYVEVVHGVVAACVGLVRERVQVQQQVDRSQGYVLVLEGVCRIPALLRRDR